jgi:hypothetical protein
MWGILNADGARYVAFIIHPLADSRAIVWLGTGVNGALA